MPHAANLNFDSSLEYDDAILSRQHDLLMSPLVWDVAHVANYEDLWLVRALGGEPTREGLDDLYDAFKQPRRERAALPILGPAEAVAYGGSKAALLDCLGEFPPVQMGEVEAVALILLYV